MFKPSTGTRPKGSVIYLGKNRIQVIDSNGKYEKEFKTRDEMEECCIELLNQGYDVDVDCLPDSYALMADAFIEDSILSRYGF